MNNLVDHRCSETDSRKVKLPDVYVDTSSSLLSGNGMFLYWLLIYFICGMILIFFSLKYSFHQSLVKKEPISRTRVSPSSTKSAVKRDFNC